MSDFPSDHEEQKVKNDAYSVTSHHLALIQFYLTFEYAINTQFHSPMTFIAKNHSFAGAFATGPKRNR